MDEEQKKLVEELLFTEEEKPSLAKMLFFGALDWGISFPFPYPDPQEIEKSQGYLKELEEFVEKNIDPDEIDRNSEIPQSVIDGLASIGFLGATASKEHGGLGFSQYTYCRCMEIVARRCGATAVFVNAHQSIGLKALTLFGTPEQRKHYLQDLATGKKIAAFSLTEPNAGSDAGGIETEAIYDPEKKVYYLRGQKQWTTNGSIADVLTVMAKTTHDGKKKVTAFLVDSTQEGFKVLDPALDKVGIRGTKTANLAFKDLEVSEDRVLGTAGKGLKVCLSVLNYGRITFGATCTGIAKDLLEMAVSQSQERVQFKKTLSHFPLIKKKIAKIASLSYAMDATTYMTAGIIDRGEEDVMLEASILKVFASEALWDIIYETMQIYGGRSFFTDQPLERIMRDARLNMIGEGANEVLKAFIAAVGMGEVGLYLQKHFMKEGDSWKNPKKMKDFSKEVFRRFKLPKVPIHYPRLLGKEAKGLARCIRKCGLYVVFLLGKYKEDIVDKQLVLERVSNAIIGVYTCIATISKIDSDLVLAHGDTDKLEQDLKSAKYYLNTTIKSINKSLRELSSNHDEQIESLSDCMTGNK
jgi:acyl-CoA dehydrogenase family member 9